MIVRVLDDDGDWNFGKGKNDYRKTNERVGQNVRTRILQFVGDCFFNIPVGIDWFNILGGKDLTTLKLNLGTTILNTQDVTGLLELNVDVTGARLFKISYRVQTTYGVLSNTFQYDLNGLV